MRRTRRIGVLITFCLLLSLALIAAEGSRTIGYQGRLLDGTGQPVSGAKDMTFTIYDGETAGGVVWTETQPGVTVTDGIFSVRLGKVTPLEPYMFAAADRWLGVQVAADAELSPRVRLASVGYAMNAHSVSGKRVQAGVATLNVTDSNEAFVDVSYPEDFNQNPVVIVSGLDGQIDTESFLATEILNQTVSGCRLNFRSLSGNNATGSAGFSWIAVGE